MDMRWSAYVFFGLCLSLVSGTRVAIPRIIDLSHWLDESSPRWPGHTPFNMTILELRLADFIGQSEILMLSSHFGTHIDAPIHIWDKGWKLDEIPVEDLCGPAVVIKVERKAKLERDYAISRTDIRKFENKNGRIPKRGIVLFHSGWGDKWNDAADFLGTTTKNTSLLTSPGLGENAARFLVTKRNIVGIGVDTVSYDVGSSTDFKAHVILSRANKWGLENVANLRKMPRVGCDVCVFPLKLKGASGAPARVVAFCPDSNSVASPVDRSG